MDEKEKTPGPKSYKLQGVIIPAEWDDDGKPIAVMLSDFDEDEYLIEKDNPFTRELLKLLKRIVTIYGCSIERENGKKILSFKGYSLL